MAEYIDREKLRMYPLRWEFCDKENADPLFIYGVESLMEYVEWLPAADVAPVVHGEWTFAFDFHDYDFYHCSVCGRLEILLKNHDINAQCPYCHCGAKMDGGAEG